MRAGQVSASSSTEDFSERRWGQIRLSSEERSATSSCFKLLVCRELENTPSYMTCPLRKCEARTFYLLRSINVWDLDVHVLPLLYSSTNQYLGFGLDTRLAASQRTHPHLLLQLTHANLGLVSRELDVPRWHPL